MDKRIYIIGAGFAGQTIADDIKRKKIFGKVNAFIDDKDKYFIYYKYLCKEIKCKNSNDEQVTKESDIGDIFRYILMYVFGMLSFIYILILLTLKYKFNILLVSAILVYFLLHLK